MKVLHLNTHASGGSYECAALLCEALTAQGIKSRVLCKNPQVIQSGEGGAPRRQGTRQPQQTRARGSSPLHQARRAATSFLDRAVRRSYVSLSTEPWHGTRRLLSPPAPDELKGIDVVHLHMVADWFNVPRWLETLPGRIGVVVSLHDMWHFTGGCFLYRGCNLYSDTCAPCPILKPPFNHVLAKDEQRRKLQAYRNRQVQFVANSQWLANLADRSPIISASGGARVTTPGIDTDIFRPQNKAESRAKLGIPMENFVIAAGAASLTDTNKNVPWLLEQLSRLPNLEKVRVILAGDGEVQIASRLDVRFMGNLIDRQERARVFGAADIFVSASLMETYGLTLIEAMGCGTPVVAFRTGGVAEAVPDGEGGILCELLDAAGFKAAIERLRSCQELRRELGTAASELVATRNAKTKFAAAFARLYEECRNDARTRSTGEGSRSSPLHLHRENTVEGGALRRRRSAS